MSVLRARCFLGPKGGPCVSAGTATSGAEQTNKSLPCTGIVTFRQNSGTAGPCHVAYRIQGLEPGPHGFHIHEKADFSQGCTSAGGHWNPHGKPHGALAKSPDSACHAGDLGNIVADENGVAEGSLESPLLQLSGDFSILGRSVMVHADRDDLGQGDNSEPGVNGKTSLTTGNAGARVACGEIVAVLGDTREEKDGKDLPVTVSATTQKLLRIVLPLPVLGGTLAVWAIWFSYQMGRTQLPQQLMPCPPISLFTFQDPQRPVYAAVMCFSAVLFVTMTSVLHSALIPFIRGDSDTRSILKTNFWWGVVAFAGLALHALVPLQSDILDVVQGKAEMTGQSIAHQMFALGFFGCSMKHALASVQLYYSSRTLPMRWERSRASIILKCLALAMSMLGFPLATYFHPAGVSAEETNTGGASQWSMVAALIAYYMTFSWDIHLVLQSCADPMPGARQHTRSSTTHGHSHNGAPCHGHSHGKVE